MQQSGKPEALGVAHELAVEAAEAAIGAAWVAGVVGRGSAASVGVKLQSPCSSLPAMGVGPI